MTDVWDLLVTPTIIIAEDQRAVIVRVLKARGYGDGTGSRIIDVDHRVRSPLGEQKK